MRTTLCFTLCATLAAAAESRAEPQTWTGDGVPAPEPVAAKITLGAYIFPGWYRDAGRGDYPYRTHDEDSEWKWAVAKQPAPRPLLGFYDDSLPEVNDWHIKWALEHGLSFFAFDWYWNAGEKRLARTLEQGFLKAKYAPQMKFCIHWCNHALDWKRDGKPAPLDFSKTALVQMTEYLADTYFKLPNYLTVDGRPVLMAFVPGALVQANGGPAGFRAVLEEMNRVLRAKGLKDLYLVALGGGGGNYADSGFSAFTAYSYYGADLDSPYEWKRGHSLPYEDMLKHFETMWQTYSARQEPHYIVPVGSNWDDRPRARQNALVITGKTPDLFEKHCRASLNYIDKRNNLAIIEAWNEWGEGSFIEPDKEFGFAFLDRVRRVYTDAPEAHADLVPSAAKVDAFSVLSAEERAQALALENQPYPPPPLAARTTRVTADAPLPQTVPLKAWEFDAGAEGWARHQTEPLRAENGALVAVATGDDPQLLATGLSLDIGAIGVIALRLKAPLGARTGEGFWTTGQEPALSGDKSFGIGLKPDGEWHTYQITKKVEGKWSGALRTLRFDFGTAGDTVLIDWIRIYGREETQ